MTRPSEERFFALITRHINATGGDIGAGITSAARWAAAHLPIYSINIVLTTPTDLYALRYPDTNDLLVLHRGAGGPHGHRHLDQASAAGQSASAPLRWQPPPRSW